MTSHTRISQQNLGHTRIQNAYLGMDIYENGGCFYYLVSTGRPLARAEVDRRFSKSTIDKLLLKVMNSEAFEYANLSAREYREIIKALQSKNGVTNP